MGGVCTLACMRAHARAHTAVHPVPAMGAFAKMNGPSRILSSHSPQPPSQGLVASGQLRGGEEWLANPALPEDVVRDSMPGEGCGAMGCGGMGCDLQANKPTNLAL